VEVGVDAYDESLARARRNAPGAVLVQANVCRVPLAGEQFDLAVALDVLEHVEAAAFLAEARRLATVGGRLLLTVPAFPSLWSPLDEKAGHRCRYRRSDLGRELEEYGWSVVYWTHYQALLFPALWLVRRSGLARLLAFERHPPGWVSRPFGFVNAAEVRLWGRRRLRFGSSLVVLARRV
jgi:SAM-dependent methyltransferase